MDKLQPMKLIFAMTANLVAAAALAAGGGADYEKSEIDPDNINSLQRGAANFMNYCSGCHSAQYVRFKTIGTHLELPEEMLVDNLMFNADKSFETIRTSMPAADAARWYGTAPPDLSLMARAKGADYIFSFLKSFYVSDSSPSGVNNTVLPGTSMPHVLWELQGYQDAIFDEHEVDGVVSAEFKGFQQRTTGQLDSEDFDKFVRDTTNFLAYIAEPVRSDRRKIGVWVMIYLIFFFIIARMLKNQIWKDVK